VVTSPLGVTLRIRWLPQSATYSVPAPSTARPQGDEKRALPPVPSALPGAPGLPARVVTSPAGVILRIVWLSRSATYTFRSPATVVTSPAGVILRTVLFQRSAT